MKSSVADPSYPLRGNTPGPQPHPPYRPQLDHHRSKPSVSAADVFWAKFVPSEGWFVSLLLAIAMGCVVFSIIAANWVEHTSLLYVCGGVGLICGFGVAKIRSLPQAALHIFTFLIGSWLALYFTGYALHLPQSALLMNLRTLLQTGVIPVLDAKNEANFLFYLSFLCFFLGYLGSWLVYHAHLPFLVVLAYTSIFLINLNYVKQDYVFLTVLFAGSLALLVARIQLVNQLTLWSGEGLYTDHSWLRILTERFMRFATLFVVLALLSSWMLPVMDQSPRGAALWNRLDNAWGNISHGNFSFSDPQNLLRPYQAPLNFFGDKMSITGSVNLPAGKVLTYTSSEANPPYLEGYTFDNFDGHNWSSVASTSSQTESANSFLPQSNNSPYVKSVTTRVTMVAPPGGTHPYIFAPAEPLHFNRAVTIFSTQLQPVTGAWVHQGPFSVNEQYEVTSNASTATTNQLSMIPLPMDDSAGIWTQDINYNAISNYYLQKPLLTPEAANQIMDTLHTWTRGTTNTYDEVHAIESHLRDQTQFTYSTSNPPVPDDIDAVSWLLKTKRGYCTYYATAMAIMTRLLDIPSRVVIGFTPGHFDATQGTWEVDGSDAHSWVQVYFANYGWIDFDPTPGYAVSRVAQNSHPKSSGTTKKVTTSPTPVTPPASRRRNQTNLQETNTPTPSVPKNQIQGNPNLLIGVSLSLFVCILCALLYMGFMYWWRNLYKDMPFVARMYWRFSRLASLVGLAPRQWQTPYEYSQMVGQKIHSDPTPLWHLTELFVRERWAGPQSTTKHEAEQLWPHLRRLVFDLIIRRRRNV